MGPDKETTIEELKEEIRSFLDEREWGKYHNPKDLAVSISLEASELLELFQWVKEGDVEKMLRDPEKNARLRDELADVIIYCLSLANNAGIDVSQAVLDKMEKNARKYPISRVKGNYRKYTDL